MTSYRSITLTASAAEVAALLHAETGLEERWDQNAFAELLAMPGAGGEIAVLSSDDDPVGLILWRVAADEAEILTIGVLPGHRRRGGVAHFLLETSISAMRRHGVNRLFLEVAVNNTAAIGLYRGFGFQAEGQRPAYYRTASGPIDAAIFVKHLAPDA